MAQDPSNARFQRDVYWAYIRLGDIKVSLKRYQDGIADYNTALAHLNRMSVSDERNRTLQRERATLHRRLGFVEVELGEHERAVQSLMRGHAEFEMLVRLDPKNGVWRCDLARSHDEVGIARQRQRQPQDALVQFQLAADAFSALLANNSGHVVWLQNKSVALEHSGETLAGLGKQTEAIEKFRESRSLRAQTLADDPTDPRLQRMLRDVEGKIAGVTGDAKGAGATAARGATRMQDCGIPLQSVIWR